MVRRDGGQSVKTTLIEWSGRARIATLRASGFRREVGAAGTNCMQMHVLEFVLEREPGSGSIQFSAYGYIAPTRRLCVSSMTCARSKR